MHAMLPLLRESDFPALDRGPLTTLQVNLGYRCNQQCLHCHVNASPRRRESMDGDTARAVIGALDRLPVGTLDITGGAPELNPHFRDLVRAGRERGLTVMDRCNLTILSEPGQEDLAEFLAEQKVVVVASLPCYLPENVDGQRGRGVFARSIEGLKRLNALGYGHGGGLELNLVYNPTGAHLPPDQAALEADYKRRLYEDHGIVFDRLFTLANMPIARFGSTLVSKGAFDAYMTLLKDHFNPATLAQVMCRSLISVDWRGWLYDCDFNQMLDLPARLGQRPRTHIRDLDPADLEGAPIVTADHCYGCTAGAGSSCGGALA